MDIFGPHAVDGYKLGHRGQDAEGLTMKYSNLTPRSNRLFQGIAPSGYDGKMAVVGIQGAWKEIVEIWHRSFFSQPKDKVMKRYKRRVDGYLGPDVISYDAMAALHDLGYLPLVLKTLDEGVRVPMQVPILTLKNTHPDFGWVVNYFETILSDMVWKTCTNAEIAYQYKRLLTEAAIKTGSALEGVQFQAHDFSARGMSGIEDATRSGLAHLTCFVGTDTVSAIDYAEDYYGADSDNELIGCSVPATEHAVSSINILVRERNGMSRLEAEKAFMKDLITINHPSGIVSYVADTYDYWAVLTEIVPANKDVILARDGKLVIRPDSGDPLEIICGAGGGLSYETMDEALCEINDHHFNQAHEDCEGSYNCGSPQYETIAFVGDKHYIFTTPFEYNRHDKTYYYIDNYDSASGETVAVEIEPSPEQKGSLQVLWETFGGTITETGHKLLDSHIGLIYGDSITLKRAEAILNRMDELGFASGNIVFGVGSFTYQYNTRDTFGSAMKATAAQVNGELVEVFKDPKTGTSKKSAKGFLYVSEDLVLTDRVSVEKETTGALVERFKDGQFLNQTNLQEIRNRLK